MKDNNYQVLVDYKLFNKFLDWLPDLKENEKYYCCLFARKKYCKDVPWIKSDKGQLKRFLSNKQRLQSKIRQLHCEFGAFELNGNPVPQESLALYITPNPRDLYKVCFNGIKKLAELLEKRNINSNPHQEIMSEVQRTNGTKHLIHFDFDWKDDKKLEECIDICDGLCDVIETRGGYHLFVRTKDAPDLQKQWYPKLHKYADQNCKPSMVPVVGCYQGGFIPKFIYQKEEKQKE